MKFSEFDLRPEVLAIVNDVGFTEATPIQEAVIPHILNGKDVSGLAQTGTGKTAAFVLPLIDRILRARDGDTSHRALSQWKKNSFVLVLVPTRELASQVEEAISQFGKNANMRSVVIAGGAAYDSQKKALHEGVEFVVGTPGRLIDLYKSHDLDLNGVRAIVFDEADRMFDMGFKDDMKFLLRRVPRDRQFLLFSATLNFDVLNTSYQFGAEPVEFNVSRDQATAEGIDHEVLHVGQDEKPMYLLSVLKKYSPQQCIVFSNFKHNVGRISHFLKKNAIEATEMSSLLSQPQRNRVLEAFKSGKKAILVATDVAARGLDIKGIDLVVNYDLPDDAEGYVHRIGRTGRAGTSGKAVGLVSDRDVDALTRIESYLKEKVKIGWLEDTDLIKEFEAFGGEPVRERPAMPPKGRPQGRQPRVPRQPRAPRQAGPQGQPQGQRQNHAPAPQREAHGQTANSSHSAVSHTHRDRRLGRHGGVPGLHSEPARDKNHKGSQAHGKQGRPHGHKPQGRKQHANGPQSQGGPVSMPARRPLKKGGTHRIYKGDEEKSEGLGAKVKSFFNKLFR